MTKAGWIVIGVFFALFSATTAHAQWVMTQDRGSGSLFTGSYALLIGISDYDAGWPKLKGVPGDIESVEKALKSVGFETETAMDLGAGALETTIKSFIGRRGAALNNRLLIYYAGHGHTQKTGYGAEIGYLVPRDAPDPTKDPGGFKTAALSMQTIEVFARQIDAKHALFVFDSCFSGSIFHATRAVPDFVQEKSARAVRQFITSGAADQTVPDQSIFRREFVAAITGEAGVGKDGFLSGSQLGAYLEEKVTNYSRRAQTPQYGKIQDPNLDRGDFIFFLPAATPPGTQSTASQTSADADLVFWQSIGASLNPADYQEYLKQFPNGRFAGLARIRSGSQTAATPLAGFPPPPPLPERLQAVVPSVTPTIIARPPAPTSDLAGRLSAATRAISPEIARSYAQASAHKAIAIAWNSLSWRSTGGASREFAELRALEGCQIHNRTPCGLVAIDDELLPATANGSWPTRSMPRVEYAGPFDPAKIPVISDALRASAIVVGYASARGGKAIALTATGRLYPVTGAANQTIAEDRAIQACDDDPEQGRSEGACYLYAAGDRVVLPQRLTVPQSDPQAKISLAALRATGAGVPPGYPLGDDHRAAAVNVEKRRLLWVEGVASQDRAGIAALESCQINFGAPCVLLALGSQALATDPATAPRRDMERVGYRGPFKLNQAPLRLQASEAVKTYGAAPGPKAMAITPDGARAYVASAPDPGEAERTALAACEAAAVREYPCLLYASGDVVVLPDRRTAKR